MQDIVQYRLVLVSEKDNAENTNDGSVIKGVEILKQMEKNGVWRTDADGKFVCLQYSGQEFKFRPKQYVQVPKNIGEALLRASHILVGKVTDALTNPDVPFLRLQSEHVLGVQEAPPDRPITVCEICGEDQKTLPRKARHYLKAHAEKEEKTTVEAEELETQEA